MHGSVVEKSKNAKQGGYVTFPFILATMAGLTLSSAGLMSNLIVYLIEEFNVKSIAAAKIFNFVNGTITLLPIVGAIIADSFIGCFPVVWISSLISLLGTVLIILTATINGLRPPECLINGSKLCKDPSTTQHAVLYIGLALACIGTGGNRFTIGTMGADQLDKAKHKEKFFNWYVFTMYVSSIVGSTALVYVEDSVSWGLGFGLCAIANILGLAIFLAGTSFYRRLIPQGTPFSRLARVIIAAILKRNVLMSLEPVNYYSDSKAETPTRLFKFLNRASMIIKGDTNTDGSIAKPWRLSSIEQVEDLKTLIKLSPLWTSGILLADQIAIQGSMAVLQALKMDRHLGHNFQIPAGSIIIFVFVSTALTIPIIDLLLSPILGKFSLQPLTPLQRVGVGHVLTVISMDVSALVETKRLKLVDGHNDNTVVPMTVLWLFPQLALTGISEAFDFPGHIVFYYQQFPVSLKSTSTAVVAMFVGIAFYLSNPLIDLINKLTGWLPDNINNGRLDNVYWVCCVVGVLNFGYFLVCARLYKYIDVVITKDDQVDG